MTMAETTGQELSSISEVVNGGDSASSIKPESKGQKSPSSSDGPPAKTEKPRPHVCTTCSRSFARLEHLKRHERSHTKEKPFECPDCTRCFARRDLLLRHQQKLHMTTTPSSRPRNPRRDSTSSSRVRKNSIVNGGSSSMRPRANTISHVGGGSVGMMAGGGGGAGGGAAGAGSGNGASGAGAGDGSAAAAARTPQHGHSHHPSLSGISSVPQFDLRSIPSETRHGSLGGLSKLDTSSLSNNVSESLRTAPVFGSFDPNYGFGNMLLGHGSTINPAQLHFGGSPPVFADTPTSPFQPPFSTMGNDGNNNHHHHHHHQSIPEVDPNNYAWTSNFDNTMTFGNDSSAIDNSSPSAMSTGSQSGVSEAVLDGSNQAMTSSAGPWSNAMLAQSQHPAPNQLNLELSGTIFQEICPPNTVSPKSLMGGQGHMTEASFATPPPATPTGPSMMSGPETMFSQSHPAPGDNNNNNNNNISAAHVDPFHQNFFPSAQPEYVSSITEPTRQSLMSKLRQPSGFNHRRFSQPSPNASSSVTQPGTFSRASNIFETNSYVLPSTADLQRYISAYVNYFHPHMPFLHIPTLDFNNAPEYQQSKASPIGASGASGSGGGGCLILSMAAIGALFEFDIATSKELFECAKKMIQLYLEERRKADMTAALSRSNSARDTSVQNTPLWLVQAMLLNVIYGHHCDDKTSADIASTHCAALVSLARAAELTQFHPPENLQPDQLGYGSPAGGDVQMNGTKSESWSTDQSEMPQEKKDWLTWKAIEERKRTLYAIFTLSSLLVSAYNHAPALTNSEIRLGLPCDEQLWAAESPQAWMALGGTADMEQHSVRFADALKTLLVAGQQSQHSQQNQFGLSVDSLKPSTFGCLVLIHALHNYVWETRQQHMGKQWTSQETEAMHVHIEPALRAWQAVWSSNPHHRMERPNPYGLGPLSADSIPLLDLAYIRLYVNLGRSKEAFWQRDWDTMTDELSRASEVIPHPDGSPGPDFAMSSSNHVESENSPQNPNVDYAMQDLNVASTPTSDQLQQQQQHSSHHGVTPSKNERHLRKAAFYAADSLSMSDKFGSTFAEFTSRELPIQSAMCTFDCAQVLAEWVATIQDRIGPYLGILGQNPMDLSQVPAIMLLEDEDYTLIQKIEEFLGSTETKVKDNLSHFGSPGDEPFNVPPSLVEGGYSTKILFASAYLLNRAGVWPVTSLMAQAIEVQGVHMRQRAQRSVSTVMS